jgi:hypothetical protein
MEDEKFVRNGLIEERVDVRGLEMPYLHLEG